MNQAAWGNQIRTQLRASSRIKQVKDLRTKRHESSDPDAVLGGNLEAFITAYLEHTLGE